MTNFRYIYSMMRPDRRGDITHTLTKSNLGDLSFDFLGIDLGETEGFQTFLNMYLVQGLPMHNPSLRLSLHMVDGIVFVADSKRTKEEENIRVLQNLQEHMSASDMVPDDASLFLQYNKRDLPDALPIDRLESGCNNSGSPSIEAVASHGVGVAETLKRITQLVLDRIR